jgi:hypothetical protein
MWEKVCGLRIPECYRPERRNEVEVTDTRDVPCDAPRDMPGGVAVCTATNVPAA